MDRSARFIFLSSLSMAGVFGAPASSVAQAPPGKPVIGRLLAVGDIANCMHGDSTHAEMGGLIKSEIEKAASQGIELRILLLGDIAYGVERDSKAKWKIDQGRQYGKCFDDFVKHWGAYKDYFIATPGNHDDNNDEPSLARYRVFFDLKKPGFTSVSGDSFKFRFPKAPNWTIISYSFYTQKSDWLRDVLRNDKSTCKIVMTHTIVSSSGHHGRKSGDGKFNYTASKHILEHSFNNTVSLLLTAHDHNFEQFARMNADYARDDANGVRLFVVGTGGVPPYGLPTIGNVEKLEPSNRHAQSEVFNNMKSRDGKKDPNKLNGMHGFLRIDLHENAYSWSFASLRSGSAMESVGGKEEPCVQ
jgi:acid phosphatase type 7